MASLNQKRGRWTVQFRLRPNQDRVSVALGKMTQEDAEGFRVRVSILVEAYRAESPPDPSTAKWVAKLSDAFHNKLAQAGLVVPRDNPNAPTVPLLGAWVDRYIEKRKVNTKPGTRVNYQQARRHLVKFFGGTRPLNRINQGEAEEFMLYLRGDGDGAGLAANTARRLCGRAKQFFADAVKHKLIAENPFTGIECSILENRDREYFVTREEAARVLESCPNAEWRLLFALSRYGGLRCPSEHLGLRWQDVNWGDGSEPGTILVHSPKTAHQNKPTRLVPLFPELRPYLEDAHALALERGEADGAAHVIRRYRDRNSNLRTQLERIICKAGLNPWPKPFQNLRSTRETELAETFPIHVVCEWIGNTPDVARKHYLQTTAEHFRRAAGLSGITPEVLQIGMQAQDEIPCNSVQPDMGGEHETLVAASSCSNTHYNALPEQTFKLPGKDSNLE